MVTTLVSYNPDAGEDTSLDSPKNRPGHIGERVRKEVEVIGRDIIEERGNDQVMSNVRERAKNRTLETVRWDGFLDLAECEWRLRVRSSLQNFRVRGGRRNRHSTTSTHVSRPEKIETGRSISFPHAEGLE
ncbi:hypothetical protein OIU84_010401 [Salix udensis]|uniref:Uncharacterized protein n=1 Tax=Salix udensis TaxID=889485 RepID=A0AAD6JML1_9ROSI|nr:hypothetical protein OIU84_010401 [Salix udensis]